MNKKSIIFSCIALILIIVLVIIKTNGNNEENKETIKSYNSDKICTLSTTETLDGYDYEYTDNVYIYLEDDYVIKTIFQNISTNEFASTTYDLTKSFLDMYNGINGVKTDIYTIDNSLITEITYNYKDIDLSKLREELKGILDKDAFLNKIDTLPVKYDDFINSELTNYQCK